MNKQTLVVVIAAVGLFAVALAGALVFTGGSGSDGHRMPDGQTMTRPMHTRGDGQTMTGEMP